MAIFPGRAAGIFAENPAEVKRIFISDRLGHLRNIEGRVRQQFPRPLHPEQGLIGVGGASSGSGKLADKVVFAHAAEQRRIV